MKTERASWCWINGRTVTSPSRVFRDGRPKTHIEYGPCTCGKSRTAAFLRKLQAAKENQCDSTP